MIEKAASRAAFLFSQDATLRAAPDVCDRLAVRSGRASAIRPECTAYGEER